MMLVKKTHSQVFKIAVIGNVLEHYDQALYGFLIPFLAPLFFPSFNPIYSLIAAYALLPVGLISKPLGAYVFGRIGDRWGRNISLSITLIGMALATAAMGFLPTFDQAGWLAPALLACGRLFQNFFAAGETTGGALFLLEKTKEDRRGWMSSLFDASGIGGILLAALAAASVGMTHWRFLFWLGGLSGVAGWIIRRHAIDTGLSNRMSRALKKRDWFSIAALAIVSGFSYGNYYLLSTFLNGYLPLVSQVDVQSALYVNTALLIIDFFLLPCFGWWSLRVEKETLMLVATILSAALAIPLFVLLDGATVWVAALVRIFLTILGVCLAAPYHAWAMEIAPVERRFTVCALGSAIGSRLIGAPMPAIGLWVYQKTGWVASPALPLVVTALLAAGTISYLKAKRPQFVFHRRNTP